MDNISTTNAVQNTTTVTTTSKTGMITIGAVLAAIVSGHYDYIPPQYALYVAGIVIVAHFLAELIPQPASDKWYYWPYRALNWLGGNFKWAEEKVEGKNNSPQA